MSIVAHWQRIKVRKFGDQEKAVKTLNILCPAGKIRSAEISLMKKGRNVPDCLLYHMMHDILRIRLKEIGFKNVDKILTQDKYLELLESLNPVMKWRE